MRYKETGAEKAFYIANTLFLVFMFLAIIYPLIYIVSCSFSSTSAILGGRVWLLPVDFSLLGYETIFQYEMVWIGYYNTIVYALGGTALGVALTVMMAYPLSRKDFYPRSPIMFLVTFTMMFSGGIIPSYLLVMKLGLIDTRWAIILPGAVSAWNIIITRTYFQSAIPDQLLEASQLDGCSDFKFFMQVALPLSGAIIATNALFYAVGYWNNYFSAMMYINRERLFPLQLVLRNILILNSVENKVIVNVEAQAARAGLKELLKYSLIVVSTLPMMAFYPFLQKYFVRGVMIGSIKG